jgi:hypothetical protein
MSKIVYSTSTGQRNRTPSSEVTLSDAVTIFLEPEEGFVTIGGYRLPAGSISDEQGEDGQVGFFTLAGRRWDYEIALYDDHAVVGKQALVDSYDGAPPSYYGDVGEFMKVGSFARELAQEIIPDCLVAHLREPPCGPTKIEG